MLRNLANRKKDGFPSPKRNLESTLMAPEDPDKIKARRRFLKKEAERAYYDFSHEFFELDDDSPLYRRTVDELKKWKGRRLNGAFVYIESLGILSEYKEDEKRLFMTWKENALKEYEERMKKAERRFEIDYFVKHSKHSS